MVDSSPATSSDQQRRVPKLPEKHSTGRVRVKKISYASPGSRRIRRRTTQRKGRLPSVSVNERLKRMKGDKMITLGLENRRGQLYCGLCAVIVSTKRQQAPLGNQLTKGHLMA